LKRRNKLNFLCTGGLSYALSISHIGRLGLINVFDAGKSITQAIGRGWALKMALASLIAISGPQKVSNFGAHPFQWSLQWMLPASKSLRPAPYEQQIHIVILPHFFFSFE
jgi:hypothetical protein